MIHYNRQKSRQALLKGEVPTWIRNSSRRAYITRVVLSIPPWVDQKELLALNAQAAELTKATGILHHLDHAIPLSHPRVCGLTVPWNLKIVPWRVNLSKSNYWCPEQIELFPEESPSEDGRRAGPFPLVLWAIQGPDPEPDCRARPAMACVDCGAEE
jgi:hypothetical protein